MEKSKYSCRHTFSGKLVCAECGGNYVGGVSQQRADKSIRRSWRCSTAVNYGKKHIVDGKEIGCDNERVNDQVLKECFTEIFKQIISNKAQIKKDIETTLKNVIEKCRCEVSNVDDLIKQKERLERERSKLLDLCLKEIVTDEEYKEKSTEINKKLSLLDEEIKAEEDKKNLKDNIDDIINNIRKKVDSILNIKKFSENVCKELVDKVIVYNKKKFDFYLKSFSNPFNLDYKSDILYGQH